MSKKIESRKDKSERVESRKDDSEKDENEKVEKSLHNLFETVLLFPIARTKSSLIRKPRGSILVDVSPRAPAPVTRLHLDRV